MPVPLPGAGRGSVPFRIPAHGGAARLARRRTRPAPGFPLRTGTLAAMDVRYAQSGDLNVAYRVLGDGPLDLVWVPNWISNVDWIDEPIFERFFQRLAGFARVIVFDRRGTGLSDPSDGAPDLEERMDDIRAVMDAAGSERAALFGYSEGGPMTALFAASHPDRVSALILFGSYAKTTATDDYPWGPARMDGRWGRMIADWGTGRNLAEWVPSVA